MQFEHWNDQTKYGEYRLEEQGQVFWRGRWTKYATHTIRFNEDITLFHTTKSTKTSFAYYRVFKCDVVVLLLPDGLQRHFGVLTAQGRTPEAAVIINHNKHFSLRFPPRSTLHSPSSRSAVSRPRDMSPSSQGAIIQRGPFTICTVIFIQELCQRKTQGGTILMCEGSLMLNIW